MCSDNRSADSSGYNSSSALAGLPYMLQGKDKRMPLLDYQSYLILSLDGYQYYIGLRKRKYLHLQAWMLTSYVSPISANDRY